MTKTQLIEKVAITKGISVGVAEGIVGEFFGYIEETLTSGNRVELRGFGSFEVREYDGYTGRNPKTGDLVEIKPKKAPFFKTGKDLKERLEAGES